MTENQKLLQHLVNHKLSWHKLAKLPDEICETLIPIARANRGNDFFGRIANSKLKYLATLSNEQIVDLWNRNFLTRKEQGVNT